MSEDITLHTLEPEGPAERVILWLHGLGANYRDLQSLAESLNLPASLNIRHLLPNAPIRPITVYQGAMTRAWYDVFGYTFDGKQDEVGIPLMAATLRAFIQEQIDAGIPSRHIYIGGFSMGGAMTFYLGLRHPEPLGGIVTLSTYFPLEKSFVAEKSIANQHIPIFAGHGDADDIIPLSWAKATHVYLSKQQYKYPLHIYPGVGHTICDSLLVDLRQWFLSLMP